MLWYGVYVPKELGNPQTNYRQRGLFESQREAEESPAVNEPGAVIAPGERSSHESEMALPALSKLVGRELKPPLSCGCAHMTDCPHRGNDLGFGLVTELRRVRRAP